MTGSHKSWLFLLDCYIPFCINNQSDSPRFMDYPRALDSSPEDRGHGVRDWSTLYNSAKRTGYHRNTVKISMLPSAAITFSDYRAPLFKMLNLSKLLDIVKLHTGIFMLCFCNGLLPVDFDHFFSEIKCIHAHYTRLA